MSKDDFVQDDRTYDAVVRNVELIGEAANNLPDWVKTAVDQIEWRKIVGLRNILAHAYFGVDDEILWDIVQTKVPELLEALEQADLGEG
jgi:uncharacterized protein with HEPN domain